MNPEQFAELRAVNYGLNQVPFEALPGPSEPVDWWGDESKAGWSWVCRDYVLAKAKELRERGWPEASLAVILCWTEGPDRARHAVLGVRDEGLIWILDNRVPEPYRLDQAPLAYTWDKIQVAGSLAFEAMA